jgi:capsular exopolysaccharide synthesis family protein
MEPQQNPAVLAQAELLPALRRHRWTIAVSTLLAAVAAYLVSSSQPSVYQAEARLLLEDPRDAGLFNDIEQRVTLDPQRYVRNQAEFINSAPVLARTRAQFDQRLDIEEIDRQVDARAGTDLDLVTIRAEDAAARGAARLANITAEAYQELVAGDVQRNAGAAISELSESKAKLQATIAAAEKRLANNPDDSAAAAERDAAVSQLITIEGRAEQLSVDASLYGSGVKFFERASAPDAPARPQPVRNALVAALLALLGSAAIAWWRTGDTQTADDPQDPAAVLRAPLLGEIPSFEAAGVEGPMPTVVAPHSAVAEAYHFVLAALDYFFDDGDSAKTLMLTSCKPDDGKTVTALNMAVSAAMSGQRVVLVDADKRRRGLSRIVDSGSQPGLAELADEPESLDGYVRQMRITSDHALGFVAAGRDVDDPAAFFRTARFRRALRRLSDVGELTIVDTPPLLAVADTSAIAAQADGIVVVVERGTPRHMLEELRHRLDFVGTPVLGYVFNRTHPRRRGSGYPYGYGYAYGADDDRGGRREESASPVAPVGVLQHMLHTLHAEPFSDAAGGRWSSVMSIAR